MNADFHIVVFLLDDGKELDLISEFIGKLDVGKRDIAEPLNVNGVHPEPFAVCESGKDRRLVRSIESVNVEGWIRFRIAELLRILENRGEINFLALHPCQDIIAGAVHDTVDTADAVADKTFAQAFDDRNSACHTGFIINFRIVFFGCFENLFAMFRKQRLVCRHDSFAFFKRFKNEFFSNRCPADEFDHHIDLVNQSLCVRRQNAFRHLDPAVCRDIEVGNLCKNRLDSGTFCNRIRIVQKAGRHAGANGSEPDNSYFEFFHQRSLHILSDLKTKCN